MEMHRKTTLEMHTLLLCADVQFLGITRNVLNQLQIIPKTVKTSEAALGLIQEHEFDVIVVDWREIDNLAEFLCAVQRSKSNHKSVLVAIVRDLLDLQQAFAAGVHFLIHKPASALQIERCLRAAYCARVAQRRRQHREAVSILASFSTPTQPLGEAMVANLSEGGAGLRFDGFNGTDGHSLSAGTEIELRFAMPETGEMFEVEGKVVWASSGGCGVRFTYIPEQARQALDLWLTECVERSLARLCERIRSACA